MELLKELCKIPSVSGNEEKCIDYIKNYVQKFSNNIKTDNMNNLIVCMNGDISDDTILIECGVDTFGVMICAVEDNKKAVFDAVGAVSPYQLVNNFAEFNGEIIGIIRTDKKLDADLQISDLYIELNVADAETSEDTDNTNTANSIVNVGDFCNVKSCVYTDENSGLVFDNFLSARIPSYCGLKLVEELYNTECKTNVAVMFTTQRKIGARGVKALLGSAEMSGKFIVSVGCAKADENFKSGKGCGILAKDSGTVTSLTIRKNMQDIATEKEIKYQVNINSENQFINAISISGCGYLCGGINIPIDKMGQQLEKVNFNDVNSAVELLCAICK